MRIVNGKEKKAVKDSYNNTMQSIIDNDVKRFIGGDNEALSRIIDVVGLSNANARVSAGVRQK